MYEFETSTGSQTTPDQKKEELKHIQTAPEETKHNDSVLYHTPITSSELPHSKTLTNLKPQPPYFPSIYRYSTVRPATIETFTM